MNKYYLDFIMKKLENDIKNELISKNQDKEEIILRETIDYFQKNEIVFEENTSSSGTHQRRNRDAYKGKKNKCKARIWNEGHGGQCSCSGKKEYDNYCKTHFNKGSNWWLGTIDEPRPERPINSHGKVHYWLSS